MNLKVRTALRYPGGKARALKKILPRIPGDYDEFREPFVGGGSVFIAAKKTKNESIFRINDLNYDLFCFWKQLRDNSEDLIKEIFRIKCHTLDGRELHKNLITQTSNDESEFESAIRFFILNRITFSGLSNSGGYSQESFDKRFTLSSIERLKPLSELIQDVQITNNGYEKLVKKSGDNVFIFLDPPYFNARGSKLYGKNGDLHTSFDHELFAKLMKKCNHRWLITCDDSPEIRNLFDFAQISTWKLQYGVNNGKISNGKERKAKKGNELFIYNYEL
ncbi:MAG: DNA adenine methylase [Methanosarcinaceae archaeon]|nr:DNA adenine methylase [Methanosarcinaceae archaeon]